MAKIILKCSLLNLPLIFYLPILLSKWWQFTSFFYFLVVEYKSSVNHGKNAFAIFCFNFDVIHHSLSRFFSPYIIACYLGNSTRVMLVVPGKEEQCDLMVWCRRVHLVSNLDLSQLVIVQWPKLKENSGLWSVTFPHVNCLVLRPLRLLVKLNQQRD